MMCNGNAVACFKAPVPRGQVRKFRVHCDPCARAKVSVHSEHRNGACVLVLSGTAIDHNAGSSFADIQQHSVHVIGSIDAPAAGRNTLMITIPESHTRSLFWLNVLKTKSACVSMILHIAVLT